MELEFKSMEMLNDHIVPFSVAEPALRRPVVDREN